MVTHYTPLYTIDIGHYTQTLNLQTRDMGIQ